MRRSRMTCGGVGGKWGLWTMKISKLFENKNPTFSFEFFPPKNADDAAQLFRRARELQALGAHFCSVTYGAGGSTRMRIEDNGIPCSNHVDNVAGNGGDGVGHWCDAANNTPRGTFLHRDPGIPAHPVGG